MLGMREIFSRGRIFDQPMDLVPVDERDAASMLRTGDLLFARQSLVLEGAGKCSVFLGKQPTTFESHLIRVRLDQAQADPLYFYYFFCSPDGRSLVASIVEQVAAAGIRGSDLARLRINPPPLPEQRAIAEVLGALDDKIEVNERMNATLDAMARALFKSWFVDFDPVRAKAEGRAPSHMDVATAALFPTSFEDSSMGLIPTGWRAQTLAEHVSITRGLSYKGVFLAEAGMPMHNLNSVLEGGGYKFSGLKHYSGEYQDRHVVRPGDLIVANTEQGHDRLLIGYGALVPAMFGDIGLFSHHLYRVQPQGWSPLTPSFLCLLLREQRYHDLVSGFANGTTVNMLPSSGLEHLEIPVAPPPVHAAFERLVDPMLKLSETNTVESRTLAELRDTLLPKLISGEVRVGDAAREVEVAV